MGNFFNVWIYIWAQWRPMEGIWRPVQRGGDPIRWTKQDDHIVRKVTIEWNKQKKTLWGRNSVSRKRKELLTGGNRLAGKTAQWWSQGGGTLHPNRKWSLFHTSYNDVWNTKGKVIKDLSIVLFSGLEYPFLGLKCGWETNTPSQREI